MVPTRLRGHHGISPFDPINNLSVLRDGLRSTVGSGKSKQGDAAVAGIPAGFDDQRLECSVVSHGGNHAGEVAIYVEEVSLVVSRACLLLSLQNVLKYRYLLCLATLRSQGAGLGKQRRVHFEVLNQEVAARLEPVSDIAIVSRRSKLNSCPSARAHRYVPESFQRGHCLPHRPATHAENLSELTFAWECLTQPERP